MTTDVLLPKLGFSMNEAVLSEWFVEDGAVVTAGQPLYSIESDKSTTEIEAPASGKIRLIGARGETYEVGTVLATIG
jgi:pyruvate/2-oxoglutarate dehydrogenase complex dihydrolipoamide acyltransferase (E2) component